MFAPLSAFAQGFYGDTAPQYNVTSSNGTTFASFVAQIIGVINTIIPVLITIALLIFFIGLVRYIIDAEDAHAHAQGGKFILWGLVAMFVLLSLWGILDVAKTSIFGGTAGGPTGATASTASQNTVVGP